MEEDSPFSRHRRSHNFNKEEVKCLIYLIEKYKSIILSKASNNAANKAKEEAWTKMTEIFNSQGFEYHRSTENIKYKWDNLKREARKVSRTSIDVNLEEFDEILAQIVNLLNETDNNTCETQDITEELVGGVLEEEETKLSTLQSEDENTNKDLNKPPEIVALTRRITNSKRLSRNRSLNFTPEECSILLNCVRSEKAYVFSKLSTAKANRLKNEAWSRITRSFNELSPLKRSTKMLQTKFVNLKNMVNKETSTFFKKDRIYMKLEDDSNNKLIKLEPLCELEIGTEQEVNNDHDDQDNDPIECFDGVNSSHSSPKGIPDPLSTVLSSDSGFGFMNNDTGKHYEDNEVTKLKMELLQYQLDNAKFYIGYILSRYSYGNEYQAAKTMRSRYLKLERERLEKAMRAEELSNETRAIETSLRLRAARLEAIAAATKLPPSHPALAFMPQEEKAQHYLNEYQT